MEEVWDVYDKDLNKIGKDCIRGKERLPNGEYHLVVSAIILNSDNETLLAQRAAGRPNGLKWELTGGSVLKGETGEEGIIRELSEEIGVSALKNEGIKFKEILSDIYHDIKQIWLFRKNLDITKDIKFNDGETIGVKFVNIEDYKRMLENKETLDTIDFTVEDYKELIEKSK